MIKTFFSFFAWKKVYIAGCNTYYENTLTGERKVVRGQGGFSPICQDWLDKVPASVHTPPIGGSGVSFPKKR